MNADKIQAQPKVRKETKNKIRVEFERTPLKERLKAKLLSGFFFKKIAWAVIRYVLLVGIAYVVLFPFFSKIAASFMDKVDLIDSQVRLIPKNFSVKIYKELWIEKDYLKAFGNTLMLSGITAIIQTFICRVIVSSGSSTDLGVPVLKYFTRNAWTSAWCAPLHDTVVKGSSTG